MTNINCETGVSQISQTIRYHLPAIYLHTTWWKKKIKQKTISSMAAILKLDYRLTIYPKLRISSTWKCSLLSTLSVQHNYSSPSTPPRSSFLGHIGASPTSLILGHSLRAIWLTLIHNQINSPPPTSSSFLLYFSLPFNFKRGDLTTSRYHQFNKS